MASPDDFIAAGIYDPVLHRDAGRLELLTWLDDLGFTTKDMASALEQDMLGAVAGDRRLLPGDRLSREEAMKVSSLAPTDYDSLIQAFGIASIDDDLDGEVRLTGPEVEAFAVLATVSTMFSPGDGAAFFRVIGSSLARIAESAVSMFLTDVESPMIEAELDELELAQAVYDATGQLDYLTPAFDPLLRRQVLQAVHRSRRSMIDHRERFAHRYAVGFVDLVGFTEISQAMSQRELASFMRGFEGRAHDVLTSAGARLVKLIGDEVMFAATDPNAACIAAEELMAGFGADHDKVLPRGGLAYGPVLAQGGDYYGTVVNLASRLVDQAVPQELLVTDELATAAEGCSFEFAGRRMVKGFAEPVGVHSLVSTDP